MIIQKLQMALTPSLAHTYGELNPSAPLWNHLIYVSTPNMLLAYREPNYAAHVGNHLLYV